MNDTMSTNLTATEFEKALKARHCDIIREMIARPELVY